MQTNFRFVINYFPTPPLCFFKFPDKILLNNGFVIGEYGVNDEANNLSKLDYKSNINEYVNQWCNSSFQIENNGLESNKSLLSNYEYETKRRDRNSELIDTCIEDISRESGILTLPMTIQNESSLEVLTMSSSNSTYLSCCSTDTQNVMEQNIFSITDESQPNLTNEISHEKTNEATNSLFNKNIDSRTFLIENESFVSISEVYIYTDDEEQVALYEKRILLPKE